MEEISDMAALFGLVPGTSGSSEVSPVERLLNEFEAHEAKEEESLEQYRKILGSLPNPATRFLLQLIISDEEKHRAVIHAMVATLKGSLMWTKPEGSLEGTTDLAEMNGRLRVITDGFIELEKAGIKDYKALAKESSGYYHGLFKILLDSMIRDSEKHIELLEFLKENLKEA
jgi:rubrerythrin